MYTSLLLLNALIAGTTPRPSVTITEIMYDPSSTERAGESEWIELMNTGPRPVDLAGWTIDDEDASDWGPLSGVIAPGELAIVINADACTPHEFRQAWSPDPADDSVLRVIAVEWGSLDNQPTVENEILRLLDPDGTVACIVNYQRGGEWPDPRGGRSIHLTSLAPDAGTSGRHWASTTSTSKGARTARVAGVFTQSDVGSPGVGPDPVPVPPETPGPAHPATSESGSTVARTASSSRKADGPESSKDDSPD